MTETDTSHRTQPQYVVPPVNRALALLRYIAKGNRCRNSSLAAKELGINRTTLIRLLATLEAEEMIETIPDGNGYRLGTALIALSVQALSERGLLQLSRPVLRALVERLNLSAHLGIIDGREIVYLARETPNSHLASTVREGTRLPAHATTIGRILLAEMPTKALHALYQNHPLTAYTEKTRTVLAELEVQLATDKARGVAWSVANFEPGIGSAAAAVYDHLGRPAGAINVTGQASAFAADSPQATEIEAALKQAARDLSRALGYQAAAETP